MHAEYTTARKTILFLIAALLIAVPVNAQTLKSSSVSVTVGQVIGCNDNQVVNVSTTSTAIAFNASVAYTPGDPRGNWLYVRDQSNNNVTSTSTAIHSTTGTGGVNLQIGLNLADGVTAIDHATVTLTSTSPAGQTITINVTYDPNLNCAGVTNDNGTMSLNLSNLNFTLGQGGAQTQYLVLTNVSTSPITIRFGISINDPFTLGIGPTTIPPGQKIVIPVTATAGNLPIGTYGGQLNIIVVSTGSQINVNLLLNVSTNGGGAGGPITAITANPSVLNFSFTPSDVGGGAQTLEILSAQNGPPVPVAVAVATYNGGPSWLTTDFVPGTATPFRMHVSANALGLKANTSYQGALVITPLGGPPVLVNVNFNVTPATVVSATPTSLKFNYTPGGAAPAQQIVQVSGAPGVGEFAINTVGGSWLHVFPPDSHTLNIGPASVGVTVDPTGLLTGSTYNGTITVSGAGPSTGVTNIAVSFTIAGPGITKVSNAASFSDAAVAPGEIISLFGTTDNPIGPDTGIALSGDMIVNGKLPTTMGGTRVVFLPSGVAAPLVYASATQVNCQVPYEVSIQDNVQVQVEYGGLTSRPFALRTSATQPGMFTATSTGLGQALSAQYDANGNFMGANSHNNPVGRGNIITFYVTGEGRTTQPVTGGITAVQQSAPYTPQPMAMPAVLIDGQPATIAFYGEAPGLMSGMMQVNVIVPANVRVGDDVLVSITVGANYSQAGVTIVTQ
jgi:trimeric autotransporter adhesin